VAALIARFGAKTIFVLATAGLMTSTAGNATITPGTVEAIKSLQEVAPAPVVAQPASMKLPSRTSNMSVMVRRASMATNWPAIAPLPASGSTRRR
jgi:hypothetical protein